LKDGVDSTRTSIEVVGCCGGSASSDQTLYLCWSIVYYSQITPLSLIIIAGNYRCFPVSGNYLLCSHAEAESLDLNLLLLFQNNLDNGTLASDLKLT
jgi:hypothetical protein